MRNTISPADVRDALRELQDSIADTAPLLALEFVAHTASRITPVRMARLTDIDTDDSIWHIPAHYSKVSFPQQIPLSRQALSIIDRAEHIDGRGSDLVFPSSRGTILGRNTLSHLCRTLSLDVRPFQFRAAFALWCISSCVPQELVDVALGYKLHYPRPFQPLFLDERRLLMQAWANFLSGDLPNGWLWPEPVPGEPINSL